jgi:hypothetical protein
MYATELFGIAKNATLTRILNELEGEARKGAYTASVNVERVNYYVLQQLEEKGFKVTREGTTHYVVDWSQGVGENK